MCDMIATSYIENSVAAQMRVTPTEDPSSEIVCLVDDDPLVLRSTGVLLVSGGFTVRRLIRAKISLLMSRHTTSRWWCWTFGWKK